MVRPLHPIPPPPSPPDAAAREAFRKKWAALNSGVRDRQFVILDDYGYEIIESLDCRWLPKPERVD